MAGSKVAKLVPGKPYVPAAFSHIKTLGKTSKPLLKESLPDPFSWFRELASPTGAKVTEEWMTGTSNHLPETFPMYRRNPETGEFERALDANGQPLAMFSEAERPAWIHKEQPDRWAPEIHHVDGKEFGVYTARHIDGDLRLASAVYENGKCRDRGPFRRAEHGVIDATITTDPERARA